MANKKLSILTLPEGTGSTTYDIDALYLGGKDASQYMLKTSGEWNQEINFGSSGLLLIGRFPMYDSGVVVEINATTSTTYHGTLVLATQNVKNNQTGSYKAVVYGDADNTITPSLYIERLSGSNVFSIYFKPASWSKNVVHIQAVSLNTEPTHGTVAPATDICKNINTLPATATIRPTNALLSNFYTETEVDNLIAPAMVMRGTLGTGGTKTSLPTASKTTLGDMYKVIKAGTYASIAAKVNDTFVCYTTDNSTYSWMLIPSGDDIEDTWRKVQVNGTTILESGTGTNPLNLVAGTYMTITNAGGSVTFDATDTGATTVSITGDGNAFTNAEYNASTRTITFTKGSTFLTSHQSLANYVTLNGAQTITGAKTFSAQPVISTAKGLKFDSGNCKLRIYNTNASPTDYAAIEVRSNNASTNRNLFIDLANNSLVVGAASGTADTTYKVNVKDTFNATTIYENGTSLANKYADKNHNHVGTYLTAESDTLQTVTTRGATTNKAITTAGLTTTSTLYITGTTGHREGIRIAPFGNLSSIWWNATGTQDYTTGQMWGITAYDKNYTIDTTKTNTFRFRGPTSATATSATDQMWINTSGLVTSRGGFAKSGSSDSYVLLAGGGTKALSEFGIGTGGSLDLSNYATKNDIAKYLPLAGNTNTTLMTGPIKYGGQTQEIISIAPEYDNGSWKGGMKYSWNSKTTIALWGKNADCQFVWHAGADLSTGATDGWANRNYDFQVGRNSSSTLEALLGGKPLATQEWVTDQLGSGGSYDVSKVSVTVEDAKATRYLTFVKDHATKTQPLTVDDDIYYTSDGNYNWSSFNIGKSTGCGVLTLHRYTKGSTEDHFIDLAVKNLLSDNYKVYLPPEKEATLATQEWVNTKVPTVSNKTINILNGGGLLIDGGSFTLNQSSNKNITLTVDGAAAGNRIANKVVIAADDGQIDSEKYAITSGTTVKASWRYNSSTDCVELVWA